MTDQSGWAPRELAPGQTEEFVVGRADDGTIVIRLYAGFGEGISRDGIPLMGGAELEMEQLHRYIDLAVADLRAGKNFRVLWFKGPFEEERD